MSQIPVDATTADALKRAEPGAELIGPDGKPVGGFVPMNVLHDLHWMLEERKRFYDEAWARVTREELEAAFAAGGEIPMAEVFKLLEKYGG